MPYKRGSRYYIRVGGVRRSAGTQDLEAAKALEAKLNHEAWLADRMGVKPPRSWQELVVKYAKEAEAQVSWPVKLGMIRWWSKHLGGERDIRSITRDRVDQIVGQHRKVTAAPSGRNATANRYVGVLSAMLNKACREWDWIERTPRFRRYLETPGRQEWLRVEEWKAVEALLTEPLLSFCRLALATGLRSGKIEALEWGQVDFTRKALVVPGNAIKRGVGIPLNETALRVLDEIRSRPVRHMTRVFPELYAAPVKQYEYRFKRIRQATGMPLGVHLLRHTFTSWLAQEGVPREIRQRLVGHASGEVHDRYTHLEIDHLRPYAAVIDRILSPETAHTLRKPLTAQGDEKYW